VHAVLMTEKILTSNAIEAAHRAEATAILILAGFRVYRPEADVSGEDLVIRTPGGALRVVQMKSRPTVELSRYSGRSLWMLFPDPKGPKPGRPWYLIKHDVLYDWVKKRHGAAKGWKNAWSYPSVSADLRKFLRPFLLARVGGAQRRSKEPRTPGALRASQRR